ncbi:MAG TPA: acetyl-CoA hydrolase/transferase C-terminal domain-containing protein [Candidatus Obscuribacterales bacterium]
MTASVESRPSWYSEYKRKLTTAEEAVAVVKSNDSVYIHSNAAAPAVLIDALVGCAGSLRNVQIYHLLTLGSAEYALPEYKDSFRTNALFIGPNVREAVNEGRADYTPVFLGEIPSLFLDGTLPINVCLIQVSPPDAHGYCSLGVSVDLTIAARKCAKVVIAEVNEQMPRTLGRSFVHLSRIDYLVESNRPLPELIMEEPDEVENAIGKHVASLVEDGATLQMGIGAIPNAVLRALGDKRNLGIHTEMFSDGILPLVEAGVINNDAKTVLPGKIAASFVMGSRRLYDFVNNNPLVEFQPSDFINDPVIISQNYKMTSINSAIEVDITGQVCADSIGHNLYSGFGGQVDFVRGATRSKGGKAIIALPSTAKNGTVSRITTFLAEGSGVVTSRADVHYIVTEYGIAYLHGKNVRQRAKALIDIAHPAFRERLEKDCSAISWLQ